MTTIALEAIASSSGKNAADILYVIGLKTPTTLHQTLSPCKIKLFNGQTVLQLLNDQSDFVSDDNELRIMRQTAHFIVKTLQRHVTCSMAEEEVGLDATCVKFVDSRSKRSRDM